MFWSSRPEASRRANTCDWHLGSLPRVCANGRYGALRSRGREQIDYAFVVEDPTYYTQPWAGESHFLRRDEPLLEYACHEANYSLVHVLEGARELERRAGPQSAVNPSRSGNRRRRCDCRAMLDSAAIPRCARRARASRCRG